MSDEDRNEQGKISLKKEIIQEIRAIIGDPNIKKRVESGIFSEAETVKGATLAVLVRALDNIERRIYDNQSQRDELNAEEREELKTELMAIRTAMKDMNIRILESIDKKFDAQKKSIETLSPSIEQLINDIPTVIREEIRRGFKEPCAGAGGDGPALPEDSGRDRKTKTDVLGDALKQLNDEQRRFIESIDLQKNKLDEIVHIVQNKIDRISVSLDEKTGLIISGICEKGAKLDTRPIEAKLDAIEKNLAQLSREIREIAVRLKDAESNEMKKEKKI